MRNRRRRSLIAYSISLLTRTHPKIGRDYLLNSNIQKLSLYASVKMDNTYNAQDVVQDTFHEAINHVEELMKHENTSGWLMQTLKYKRREDWRRRAHDLKDFCSLDSDFMLDEHDLTFRDAEVTATPAMEKLEQALSPSELHPIKRLIFQQSSHMEVTKELSMEQRETENPTDRIPDVDKAWEICKTHYHTPEGDGLSLYPLSDEYSVPDHENHEQRSAEKPEPKFRHGLSAAFLGDLTAKQEEMNTMQKKLDTFSEVMKPFLLQ